MKIVNGSCKICGKLLSLEIADSYDRDPMGLIPFAVCNHCGDIREERRSLERLIVVNCYTFSLQRKPKEEVRSAIRGVLVKLTKSYAQVIAREWNLSVGSWDEEFVNMLMESPSKAGVILGKYRHDMRVNPPRQHQNASQGQL